MLAILIVSRIKVITIGNGSPFRLTVIVTLVLISPRSSLTACVVFIFFVVLSSIFTIKSPDLMPARSAGPPSMGDCTLI